MSLAAVQFFLPYEIAIKPTNVGAPGAQMYVYAPSTTTLRPVYATSALTTQLTNPVVADGAGKFPDIYLDNALTYKIVIDDKNGAPLFTKDPYIPGTAPSSASLAPYQAASEAAATASAGSAAAASTSASAASTSATAAAGSAATAAGNATASGNSATTAASSATAAATNAGAASTSATAAATAETGAEAAEAGTIAAIASAGGTLTNVTLDAANRTILAALDHSLGLPAYLRESGREGVFVWSSANLSAKVTADTAQGIYVAPASDTSGASGAWVRKFDGPIQLDWFGLVRGAAAQANAAGNNAAIAAMWAINAALSPNGSAKVLLPVDLGSVAFEISSTIIPPGTVKIDGRGMGMGSTNTTDNGTLVIAYGCTAFRFDYNRSSLSNLVILGDFTTTEAEYHGVHFRQVFFGTNIRCQSMRGDGFYAEGTTASGYLPDLSRLVGCEGRGCRNGFFFDGADSNVMQIIGGTGHNNRRWGVWDSASIGNAYFAVETSGNGIQAANDGVSIGVSVVSNSGNWYSVIAGQEAGASTNAPSGTTSHNTWWYYMSAGGVTTGKPAWFSGILCRAGGSVRTDDIASVNSFYALYSEAGQGFAQVVQGTKIDGGLLSAQVFLNPVANLTGVVTRAGGNGVSQTLGWGQVISGDVTINIGAGTGNTANRSTEMVHASFGTKGYGWSFDTGTGNIRFAYNVQDTESAMFVTGQNTTTQFGTGSAVKNGLFVPRLALPSTIGGAIGTARQVCRAATSSATYVAASGGSTIDTQCRAAQAQLAADLADMKAKFQAANQMT